MAPDPEPCLLVIISGVKLHDTLVDWLLSHHGDTVFSSQPIDVYGLHPESLTLAEQVSGRQRKLQFQIQTDRETARQICRELAERFASVELQVWISPLLEVGSLDAVVRSP